MVVAAKSERCEKSPCQTQSEMSLIPDVPQETSVSQLGSLVILDLTPRPDYCILNFSPTKRDAFLFSHERACSGTTSVEGA